MVPLWRFALRARGYGGLQTARGQRARDFRTAPLARMMDFHGNFESDLYTQLVRGTYMDDWAVITGVIERVFSWVLCSAARRNSQTKPLRVRRAHRRGNGVARAWGMSARGRCGRGFAVERGNH